MGYMLLDNYFYDSYVVDKTRREKRRKKYISRIPKDMGMKSYWELKDPSFERKANFSIFLYRVSIKIWILH